MISVGRIMTQLGVADAQFNSAMSQAESRVGRFGRTTSLSLHNVAMAAGKGLAAVATAVISGAVVSVKRYAEFEKTMRNVNTIAKQSEDQWKETSNAVVKMSTEYGASATGLAEALYGINSASFTGAAGLKVLEAAAIAGKAGVSDTATAASGITSVLNAYGMSADKAGDVSDILFKTVERGVMTFGELSSNLGTAVSTAQMAGIPFEQVAAASATMTKGGINAAESFTALNRFMMKLIDPSKELNKVFKDAGYESAEAAVQADGLGKVMEVLLESTDGEAKAILDLGFEMRSFKAVAALASQGGETFADDLEQIAVKANRAGATQAAFEEQTKSLSYQWEVLGSTVSAIMIKIGEYIAPFVATRLMPIIETMKELVDVFEFWAVEAEITFRQVGLYMMMPFENLAAMIIWAQDNWSKLFTNFLDIAGGFGKDVIQFLVNVFNYWVNLVTNLFNTIYETIKTAVSSYMSIITSFWSNVWDIITGKKSIGAAFNEFSNVLEIGLLDTLITVGEAGAKMGDDLLNDVSKLAGDIGRETERAMAGAGFTDLQVYGFDKLQDDLDALDDEKASRLQAIFDKRAAAFGDPITTAVEDAIETGAANASEKLDLLPVKSAGAMEEGTTAAYSAVRSADAEQAEIKNNTRDTAKATQEIARNTKNLSTPTIMTI